LADVLDKHIERASWLDYKVDKDKKSNQPEVEKQKALLVELARHDLCFYFNKEIVKAAFKEVRSRKGEQWSMDGPKSARWVNAMEAKFRAMTKHLGDALKKQAKWAMKVITPVTEAGEDAGAADAGDEDEEADEDDAAEEAEEEEADGTVVTDNAADESWEDGENLHGDEAPVIVGFSQEHKKAYRIKLDGVMDFADDLIEPGQTASEDDPMIAWWNDGFKAEIAELTVKEFKEFAAATGDPKGSKADNKFWDGTSPDGSKVSVRLMQVKGVPFVVIKEGEKQLAQMKGDVVGDITYVVRGMTNLAVKYCDGEIDRLEIKAKKLEACMEASNTTTGDTAAASSGTNPATEKKKEAASEPTKPPAKAKPPAPAPVAKASLLAPKVTPKTPASPPPTKQKRSAEKQLTRETFDAMMNEDDWPDS